MDKPVRQPVPERPRAVLVDWRCARYMGLGHGRAVLLDYDGLPFRKRNTDDGRMIAIGSVEAVRAAANLLLPGEWEAATCVTPTGRLDAHGTYIERRDGKSVCSFCMEPI